MKDFFRLTVPAVLLVFIALEIVFRTVFLASDPPLYGYNDRFNMPSYQLEKKTGVYSVVGPACWPTARWSLNNLGWNAPVDYDTTGQDVLLVVGDSFVEALQVDQHQSFHARIREKYSHFPVVALGMGGSPFSHYLHLIRYAKTFSNPRVLVINVVLNDLSESLHQMSPKRKYLTVERDSISHGWTELPPQREAVSPGARDFWRRLLYKSATFRYLHRNLHITLLFRSIDTSKSASDLNSWFSDKEELLMREAAGYLFQTVRTENPDIAIIVTMDSFRFNLYGIGEESKASAFVRSVVREEAAKHNMIFIDLESAFRRDFEINRKKFEFEHDFHWNERGHRLVADTLLSVLQGLKM